MKQIDLREGARRQHRAVALFALIQCWIRGLDGLVFTRTDLERLLGLKRFKRTRVEWLQEDLKELFPHQEVYWLWPATNSFHSLYVSRIPISNSLPSGAMSTKKRLEGMSEDGPSLDFFKIWSRPKTATKDAFEGFLPFFADAANYDERFLSSYLSLLVQGQISPQALPPLEGRDS